MKIPTILMRKKKLRAATARRPRAPGFAGEMDYEQMAEPNMKLSRALLIVLVLHVVAVAGIVAFNTIKTRENVALSLPETAASATPTVPPLVSADREGALGTAHATTSPVAAPDELAQQVAAQPAAKAPVKDTQQVKSTVKDSGKIYTVAKHDNPVTIARRLKVSEADLLELNQITDPRKLQINQKLRIPEPHTTSKSKSD